MDLRFDRVVTAIDGATITLDAPLTTALDASLGGGDGRRAMPGRAGSARWASRTSAANPSSTATIPATSSTPGWRSASTRREDAWVRQVTAAHFAGSAVSVWEGCKRVTVQDCTSLRPVSEVGGYRRHTFSHQRPADPVPALPVGAGPARLRGRRPGGRAERVRRVRGDRGARLQRADRELGVGGPLRQRHDGRRRPAPDQPRDRRAGRRLGGGQLRPLAMHGARSSPAGNRRGRRTGRSAAGGSSSATATGSRPTSSSSPTASTGQQLAERLGEPGGRGPRTPRDPDRTRRRQVDRRRGSRLVHERAGATAAPAGRCLRDGWLVCDGKLLIGGRIGTTWWRGHVLPSRAPEFGVGRDPLRPRPRRARLHRRPRPADRLDARVGPGGPGAPLGPLVRPPPRRPPDGPPDRRRRLAAVLRAALGPERPGHRLGRPEQVRPDRRSTPGTSTGSAQFAGLCDRKGLVLIHQAYFQHNILEAGAHWADFPWRPANCLQETGFPEPPPYENKKRVFMAEAFYDVSHPVRRALHRLYIRKCLDDPRRPPERDLRHRRGVHRPAGIRPVLARHGRRVGAGDGQGRADRPELHEGRAGRHPRRPGPRPRGLRDRAEILVVHGRRQPVCPRGRAGTSPRGSSCASGRGTGRRSAEQTARQVREYRDRYPDKAILCAFDQADPWAVARRGRLDRRTCHRRVDRRLLAALPRMRPFGDPGRPSGNGPSPSRAAITSSMRARERRSGSICRPTARPSRRTGSTPGPGRPSRRMRPSAGARWSSSPPRPPAPGCSG